ncbi:MAG: putative signal transduction protein with EAL and GGDEF domain [Acidimicrobiales bacterium]|jgi:predicted signal transduction protein with EAL and GGDEF domain
MTRSLKEKGLPTRRLSFLAMIIAPAVPVVVIAVILTSHIRSWTTERATANAADAAALVADLAISPMLEMSDFTSSAIDPRRTDQLDATLQPFLGHVILRIKIWDRTGRVIYSDDRDSIGMTYPISHELEDALKGENSSEISTLDKPENFGEQEFDQLLEVYVPVSAGGDGELAGAFELYLPYEPIAQSIESDTRRVVTMLAVTLVGLYLALALVLLQWARSHRRAADHEHEANHDPLTGLPNRRKFQATLEARADGEPEQPVAVLFLDLDDFKTINDRHGHHVGDALLTNVADRLRRQLRADATLARPPRRR